jgi:PmbA protein
MSQVSVTATDFDVAYEQQQLEEKISRILSQAKKQGVSQIEVAASVSTGFSTTIRMGNVETLEHHRDKGFGLTVFLGQKQGSASTTDTSDSSLEATLEKAIHIARYTAEDPCNGLPEAELMAYDYPNLDLHHPWNITPSSVIDQLIACEAEAMALDKRLSNSEGASLSTSQGISVYGNHHGFIGKVPTSRHDVSLVLIAKEGQLMERDYSFTVSRDAADLKSYSEIAQEAAQKTLNRLNPRKLKTQKAPIIFHREIAAGLLNTFFSAIRGGNLYRRSSFLLDSLGQKIFPDFIHFHENPLLPKALGSAPFDAEGVVTSARDIVKEGIVQGYILSSYSARKLGMKTTGNAGGIHNVDVAVHPLSFEDLLKKMDRGFLVTEVMGQGVNLVTGDYSRGAAGFWVENGEIQYPVSEVTISGNLKEMYRDILAISNDIEKRSTIRTGSILLEKMMIAGE